MPVYEVAMHSRHKLSSSYGGTIVSSANVFTAVSDIASSLPMPNAGEIEEANLRDMFFIT